MTKKKEVWAEYYKQQQLNKLEDILRRLKSIKNKYSKKK